MSNQQGHETEFVQGVWRKVRYVEFRRKDEEAVRERVKKLRQEKIKLILLLSSIVLPACIWLLATVGVNMFSLIITGILLLSGGTLYEFIPEMLMNRRNLHENYNR